jgi:hypothetical protein
MYQLLSGHLFPIFFLGGRIIVDKLTDEGREILINFYRTYLKSELTSWDRTEPEKAERFGRSLQNRQFDKTSAVIDRFLHINV